MRIEIGLVGLAVCFTLLAVQRTHAEPSVEGAKRSALLEATSQTFERAEGRRSWVFPRDHGQHPRYRLEWWYYTGIVRTTDGRAFGFQITFFREGLSPTSPRRASAWRTQSLYLAHLAISDLQNHKFYYASRTGRDGLALSGAATDRQEVWLGDWTIKPAGADGRAIRIEARDKSLGIALDLAWSGEPVLHGTNGLDQKGQEPGQASWYYSLPRIHTAGTLFIGEEQFAVRGTTWMDHEFGTSQLGLDQVGWDWISIRLDAGFDLMVYRLRNHDGTISQTSGGTLVNPSGKSTRLRFSKPANARVLSDELEIQAVPGGSWTSPKTGARYPLTWDLRIPSINLDLQIEPAFREQELLPGAGVSFGYWEGAIWVQGHLAGKLVKGEGYLELTGYSGDLNKSFH